MTNHRIFFSFAVIAMSWNTLLEIPQAYAYDLTVPFTLESTQVLPKGVKNPRITQLSISGEARFNGGGSLEPLGARISKSVSWNDVVSSQNTEVERNLVRSTLSDSQLNSTGGPGSTTGQIFTSANVQVPTFALGISDRLTLALAVPVLSISVSADTGFSKTQEGQLWTDRICQVSVDDCNRVTQKLNHAIQEKLTRLGYEPIPSFKQVSAIGDIQMISKFMMHQDSSQSITLKSNLVVPTGRKPQAQAAIDIPTGDGRFQVGSTLIYDRFLPHHLRWNTFGGALALLPHSLERRIPYSASDSLSQETELLTRRLGGVFSVGTSLNHTLSSLGLSTGIGYQMQYLTPTSYSGGALPQERYQFLQNLSPSQTLHTGLITAGFSTVEWYRSKKFIYPFQANFTYSRPFSGRNVNASQVLSGELVLFF